MTCFPGCRRLLIRIEPCGYSIDEAIMPMKKTDEKKEEKRGKPPKEKKGINRKKPQSGRYWYDPDCGPVYPD